MRIFAVTIAALTGCGHVYSVSDKPLSGLPFFPLVSAETTTAVFEQRWFELELTTTRKAPAESRKAAVEPTSLTTTVTCFTSDEAAARSVAVAFGLSTSAAMAFDRVTPLLCSSPLGSQLQMAEPASVGLTNVVLGLPLVRLEHRRDQVPAAKALYVNATVPFGGKGNATFDLTERGTLSKATAEVADELPGSVLSFLGSASAGALAAAVSTTREGTAQAEAASTITAIGLRLTPVRRLYTLTVTREASDKCDLASLLGNPLSPSSCRASLAVEVQRSPPGAEPPKKGGAERDALSFSGSVELPRGGGKGEK